MIELSKLDTTKGKARKQELYRWAKLISASNWEEVREESEGNHYMEKARDEMIKMSRDERERYLYLREQMAISDKVSQLHSAENRGIERGRKQGIQLGIQRGELLKLITQVQKKKSNGDSIEKIAEDLLEEQELIKTIYDMIAKYPEKDKSEICDFILKI